MPGVELFHAGTARDGDRLVTAGGRVLVVTATAPSMTEAAMRAYEAADRIQFEGKHSGATSPRAESGPAGSEIRRAGSSREASADSRGASFGSG